MSVKTGSKRICLLGVSLSTGNMGVSALAAGTVASVVNSFPEAEFYLLDYELRPATYRVKCRKGEAQVKLINLRFSKKLFLRNNIARLLVVSMLVRVLPRQWRSRILARNDYLRAVLESDIVVSLAGGDSFSDIYGMGRLWYVALPQLLVLQLGKPLILLPQTLGPFKSRGAKWLASYLLRHSQVVYARDQISLEEVQRWLGDKEVRLKFCYDMAFALEPVRPEKDKIAAILTRQPGRALVGVNISGLLLMGGYSRDNMFGLKADYGLLVEEIIGRLILSHGCDVVLVPHVFGESEESDIVACRQIFQTLSQKFSGHLYNLTGEFDQHEIKYVIGMCDFFLGARMHACIAALSQCVPAVGMAYSRKFAGVLNSIGCGDLVLDLCQTDRTQAVEMVSQSFLGKGRTRRLLQSRIPKVRDTVLGLFGSEEVMSASSDRRSMPTLPVKGLPQCKVQKLDIARTETKL